jgi:predicted RNA-binding protein with PIN domain
MSWVIDGNNLLGRAGIARDDADAKRQLLQALTAFARANRTKVTCYFDGVEPEHFGKQLGGVTVIFSGSRTADELIVQKVSTGAGWKVVTSDRALADRIRRRQVEVVEAASFRTRIERNPRPENSGGGEDWLTYFSDPKNRNVF